MVGTQHQYGTAQTCLVTGAGSDKGGRPGGTSPDLYTANEGPRVPRSVHMSLVTEYINNNYLYIIIIMTRLALA